MINRTNISLFLIFLTVVLMPNTPKLGINPFVLVPALFVILGLYALYEKDKFDFSMYTFLFLSALTTKFVYPQIIEMILMYSYLGVMAFIFLSFTLAIGPWARFSRKFAIFLKNRRHVGVATFFLALGHAYTLIVTAMNSDLLQVFGYPFLFFGFTGLFIMLLMALTSWNSVQRSNDLIKWTIFHTTGFILYVIGIVLYFMRSPLEYRTGINSPAAIVFGIYWFLTIPYVAQGIKKILNKPLFINGWKQLHILVYIGYFSVIFHISGGVLIAQPAWKVKVFWSIVLFVIGSHLVGWIKKLNAKKLQPVTQPTSDQNPQ